MSKHTPGPWFIDLSRNPTYEATIAQAVLDKLIDPETGEFSSEPQTYYVPAWPKGNSP